MAAALVASLAPGPARAAGNPSDSNIYVLNLDDMSENKLTDSPGVDREPAWSSDGTRIAFSSDRDGTLQIEAMNADGAGVQRLTNDPDYDFTPAWSPDDSSVVFSARTGGGDDIKVWHSDGTVSNLTNSEAVDTDPDWSSDGRIAFASSDAEIYVISPDGSGATPVGPGGDPAWSPDGTRIAFTTRDGNSDEIYVMDADGSNPVRLTTSASNDMSPDWSPDGTGIVYASGGDLFMVNADGSGPPVQLTKTPESEANPAWSPDGTLILFDRSG
jgi:Tol biopolymer transport system component